MSCSFNTEFNGDAENARVNNAGVVSFFTPLAVPEGRVRGFKTPPLNLPFLCCVFAKYTVQPLLLYSLNPNFYKENVKNNCTVH